MALSQPQKNKRAFKKMLQRKQAQLTNAEFIAWVNRHHSRTDPYSYRGKNDISERWNITPTLKRTRIYTRGNVSSTSPHLRSIAGSSLSRSRFGFYRSGPRLTHSQRQWQHSLRQY